MIKGCHVEELKSQHCLGFMGSQYAFVQWMWITTLAKAKSISKLTTEYHTFRPAM